MEGRRRYLVALLGIFLTVLLAAGWYLHTHSIAVLNPAATIAAKQRHLIIVSTLLMLIVVLPVYIMTFAIAWKYRESNHKAKYSPDWDGNRRLEVFWWAVPIVVISVLAVVTYKSSHELDPFKPIVSDAKPITIQVVALQWRWLFIYPDQNVASINQLTFPVNTPLNFQITADAPMNSFWIPQLGGQIYAMSGMSSQLHLMATKLGSFYGSSANISGQGFASMHFTAVATSKGGFDSWLKSVRGSSDRLSVPVYNQLAKTTENNSVSYYSPVGPDLYGSIITKYMKPGIKFRGIDNYVASANQGAAL